jgi:DNA polymerase-3 subunit gamma/tau
MRDAQSTLDKVLALGGSKVSDEDVRALLGVVDEEVLLSLVNAVSASDRKGLLEQLRELAETGIEPGNLCQKLMEHVRNLMVCRAAGWHDRLLNLPESEKEPLLLQARSFTELDLIRFYDLLVRVLLDLRSHPQPFLHLEMALVKLVELARLPSLEEVVSRLEEEGGRADPGAAGGKRARAEVSGTSIPPAPAVDAAVPSSKGTSEEPDNPEAELVNVAENVPVEALVTQLETVLNQQHPSFSSILRHASSMELKPDRLVVVFPPSETSFYQVLNAPDKRELLSRLCAEITGSQVAVELRIEKASSPAGLKDDPTQDPRVQTFLKEIPGKIQLERKVES